LDLLFLKDLLFRLPLLFPKAQQYR